MNTKKSLFKKTVSVFLTALMLVGIVFCAPVSLFVPETDAATAGNYFIRVTWKVEEDGTFKKNYDGYVTSHDDDEDHQDDSAGMSIAYIAQNGTASSTQYLDMDIKSELGSTGDKTFTKELGGFPTMVYMYMNNDSALAWADTIAVVSKIEVASAANGAFTTLWSGTMQIDSISKEYGVSVGTNGDKTYLNSDSDTFVKNSSYNWSMPTPTTIDLSSSSAIDIAVPPEGETVSTDNILATVYDQYGVSWKDTATWVLTSTGTPSTASENLTGYGISLRNAIAESNCIVDITSGAENYKNFYGNTVYINAYCQNAKSVSVPINLVSESYVVRFHKFNSSEVVKTQRVTENGAATPPDYSLLADSFSAPTASGHYIASAEWYTADGNTQINLNNITADVDAYPSQEYKKHDFTTNITSVITPATCKAAGSATGTCICGVSGTATLPQLSDHVYTRQVIQDRYRLAAATCTSPAVYKYICEYCTASDNTNTFTYGEPLGHDFTSEVISEDTLVSEATCASPAVYVYTCSRCSVISDSDTFTSGSAVAHEYGDAVYTWDKDYNCTAKKVCANDSSHIISETVAGVLSVKTAADCENSGTGTYTAVFKDTANFTTQTTDAVINATGHDYGEATYTWDADYNCTAKRVCKNDSSHIITEKVAGVFSTVTAADCTQSGTGKYTATFTNTTDFTEQEKAVTINKLAHSYTGDIKSNNNGTHLYKCVNGCGLYGNLTSCNYGDYTETVAPGCTTKGSKQRTCVDCGYVQVTEIGAIGHTYGEPVYSWDADNNCTATAVCTANSAHILTEKVAGVYSVVSPATCKAAGEGRYTATFENADIFAEQTKKVTLTQLEHSYTGSAKDNGNGTHSLMCVNGCGLYGEAVNCTYGDYVETVAATCVTEGKKERECSVCGHKDTATIGFSGHSYGEAVYTWDSEYNCTATRVCANDASHIITETVAGVFSTVTPATCMKAGEGKYTATFKNTENFTAQTKDVSITKLAHSYTGAIKANGNGTHSYKCVNGCEYYGNTADCNYGSFEITANATCTENGSQKRICADCGYVDVQTIKATGHKYGIPTYTWDENGNCTATAVCENNSAHTVTETVAGVFSTVTYADCTNAGAGRYTATFKNSLFAKQTKDVVIKALGHNLVHHNAEAAGCTKAGNEAYDTCTRCSYTTFKEIPATGHTPGSPATCTGAQRCTKCNAIIANALGHDYRQTGTVAATCLEEGKIIYSCSRCSASYSTATAKVDHADGNGDGYCDVCGHDIQADRIANCSHLCHQSGFMGFIWKIVNLFNKLFKINQYCECGAKHW